MANEVSLKIVHSLALSSGRSAVVSPLTIGFSLAMARDGADPKSQSRGELEAIVGDSVLDVNSIERAGVKAKTCLWSSGDINPKYGSYVAVTYGAYVVPAKSGAKEINEWVARSTNNAIVRLLDEGTVLDGTLLLSAMHFACDWETAFDENHTDGNGVFSNFDGSTSSCSMMSFVGRTLPCARHNDLSAVCVPLQGTTLRAIFASSNSDVRRLPTPEEVLLLRDACTPRKASLQVPRTRVVLESTSLREELSAQGGVCRCWEPRGDFSALGSRRAHMTDVLHAAVLEFDEKGARGASATAVVVSKGISRSVNVYCDHPFVVLIDDAETKTIVLAAYVLNM